VYRKISAGKRRLYPSILNFIDLFKTGWGVVTSIWKVFSIFPDVIFSKGGYASFPVLMAGKLLRIPVIIHESDTVPGRVSLWASHFAKKIAVSYPEAAEHFPKNKVAYTGNPIRNELMQPLKSGAHEFLKLSRDMPTILILGGSLGAQIINDSVIDILPELLKDYQVIHQTGKANYRDAVSRTDAVLDEALKSRYKPFEYLNVLSLRMAAGAADIVISRAGSAIFEIAAWQIPAIIIPISITNGDHQRKNAYAYARRGACSVIEEGNLTPHVMLSEVKRILSDATVKESMKRAAGEFVRKDAARTIAKEILSIALKHEV
jgi:UDP-N-acetylglucosamine--N-acetylmuramyl-(pentapeptide) pyrophosphoryl-undecaprenol N-acetylglucosamine transferase